MKTSRPVDRPDWKITFEFYLEAVCLSEILNMLQDGIAEFVTSLRYRCTASSFSGETWHLPQLTAANKKHIRIPRTKREHY